MPGQEETERAIRRANAYHVLGRSLDRPALWEAELADELRRHLGALEVELRAPAAKAAAEMHAALADSDALAVAYAKLFLGPFEILAPPYASSYLDPERRLMGTVSQGAARAYGEAGLGPGTRIRDAPDHVAIELEFMYWLAFQEAATGKALWLGRQRRFWTEHLGPWLPAFARAIAQADVHPCYTTLGRLLEQFCTSEQGFFLACRELVPVSRPALPAIQTLPEG